MKENHEDDEEFDNGTYERDHSGDKYNDKDQSLIDKEEGKLMLIRTHLVNMENSKEKDDLFGKGNMSPRYL